MFEKILVECCTFPRIRFGLALFQASRGVYKNQDVILKPPRLFRMFAFFFGFFGQDVTLETLLRMILLSGRRHFKAFLALELVLTFGMLNALR